MGKIVTIYLSDEEAKDLKEFCDENRCTQYSALKTAVRHMLSEQVSSHRETPGEVPEEPQILIEEPQEEVSEEPLEEVAVDGDEVEENEEIPIEDESSSSDISPVIRLLLARHTKE